MTTRPQDVTLADFERFVQAPANADRLFELIAGEIIEVPPPSPLHAHIAGVIYAAMLRYLADNDLGFAFPDSVSYTLADDSEVIPDASFISYARQPSLPAKFRVAPDIAVEVMSPSNRPRQMLDKIERYLAAGTRWVWVVYPTERVADVYQRADDGDLRLRKLGWNDVFDGGEVLPGFQLAVRDVFPKRP